MIAIIKYMDGTKHKIEDVTRVDKFHNGYALWMNGLEICEVVDQAVKKITIKPERRQNEAD